MPGSHDHGLPILDDEKYLWCAVDIISREGTPYGKKNLTVNRRDTCHFPFLHTDSSSYSDEDPCSLCYGFSYLKIQP